MVSDPCAEAARLRAIRTAIATGDTVAQAGFGQDRVAYFKANLELLDREIDRADRECAVSEGRTVKRTRFATRGSFRRY